MRVQFCGMKNFNSNICVMIAGGFSIGKKPLTSRCRPNVKKTRLDCCNQIDHFHFSSLQLEFSLFVFCCINLSA